MYAEYKNVHVHGVHRCTQSTGNIQCISLYTEYRLSMSYDIELLQPDDDLYDTEQLQP